MRLLLRPIAVLILVLLTGCIYYNTFYNAKKNFAGAVRGTDVEPGRANKDLLEKCVTRCEKVVKYHPHSKWADDAVLLMGKCFYYMAEHRKALRKFEELETYYPKSGLLAEAYYYQGLANQALQNRDDAIESFRNSAAADPKAKFADAAAYQVVNTHYLGEEYGDALRSSDDFLSAHAKSKYRREVIFIRAQSLFELEKYEESITAFGKFIDLKAKKESRFQARLKIGEAYLKLGRTQEALDVFLALRKGVLGPLEDARLAIRIAESSRSLGDTEQALEQLEEVTVLYPRTEASAEAYYGMGEICEQDLRDLEKAREYYDKARTEAPYSEFSNEALMRSTSIAKLGEYREKVKSGEESELAETQFLLAELYYLEFNRVDEALPEYRKVVDDYPGSEYGPKAAFAIAWILDHVKKDYSEAREAYLKVVTRYPNTTYSDASEKAARRIERESSSQ